MISLCCQVKEKKKEKVEKLKQTSKQINNNLNIKLQHNTRESQALVKAKKIKQKNNKTKETQQKKTKTAIIYIVVPNHIKKGDKE